MANPPTTWVFPRRLDPSARRSYAAVLVRGDGADAMLQPGETVTSFSIALRPEASAAGMRLIQTAGKAPLFGDTPDPVFLFWVEIDAAARGNVIFDGAGVVLGIEIAFTTNFDNADQFTVGIAVAQQ